jgi:hypothetical protein
MRFPIAKIKHSPRRALRGLAGGRLTLFGVAGLVMASAVLGAAIPQVAPGRQPNGPADAVNAPVKRMPSDYLLPLLGQRLRSTSGGDIGEVAGVLVDLTSRPRAVIVRFGGFLGIGTRTVAIDWRTLRMHAAGKGDVLLADLAPQQLAQAPPYKPDARSIAVVTAPATGANAPNFGYGE